MHLAQDLQALGWVVEVLAPHAPGAARHETLDRVPVHRFRYLWPEDWQSVCYKGGALVNLRQERLNWLKLPALIFFEFWALLRLARAGRFDVIHAHWVLPQGFVAVLVGRLLKVPVVITVHGGDVFALKGRLMRWFKRFAFKRARAVTFNSSATGAVVTRLVPDHPNLHRIPMGATVPPPPDPAELDRIRAAHRRADGPLLLFVGRLVEEKGLGDLIDALAILHEDAPDATLLVVGEGQERERFEGQAKALGLEAFVDFLGWVQPAAVPSYMAAADIFVAPSRIDEGQGLTLVEAQMAGTPVIATNGGGFRDIVKNQETGLLVAKGAPREIAAAARAVCHEQGLCQTIEKLGRQLASSRMTREFSARSMSGLMHSL